MILTQQKKWALGALLICGVTVTQLFQNCGAPIGGLEGFSSLSSQQPPGHDLNWNGDHPPIDNSKMLPTQKILLAPRSYVADLFLEVFTSANHPIPNLERNVEKWIYYKSARFGGNCNIYSDYSTLDCGGISNVNLNVQADGNTMRESFRVQMCHYVLGHANGVNAALEKVSLTAASPLNRTTVRAAHSLFFRDNPAPDIVVDSLLDLDNSLTQANETLANRWRAVLTQICESPAWQLL